MIGRIKLLLSEAWRSTTSNMSTTLAAALTVLAAMFVLGCALALGTLLRSYGDHVKKQLVVDVFYCSDVSCPRHGAVTNKDINTALARFQKDPRVKSVQFVTAEQGYKDLLKTYPQYRGTLAANPLGPKDVITAKNGNAIPAIGQSIQQAHLPGVQKVDWGQTTTKKILHYANVFNILFAIMLGILGIASILLVVNTIRLSIFSRRREIEVMKLVGASNWFVRGPFMVEGLITGFLGAIAAVVLLILGREFVLPSLDFLKVPPGVHAIPFVLNALLLLVFGLMIGVLGSSITIRRFLRV